MGKDAYATLGVGRDATQEDIKKAYRKLAMKYHPDKNSGDKKAEDKFKDIAKAYEDIGTSESRQKYDNPNPFGGGMPGGFGSGFGSGFGDMFSNFNNMGHQSGMIRKGNNINARIEISLEDVLKGSKKKVNVYRRMQCSICEGTGAYEKKTKKCTYCGGLGVRRNLMNTNFGQVMVDKTCEYCQGDGDVPESNCMVCHGSGTVREIDNIEINIPKGSVSGIRFSVPGKGDMAKSPSDPGDLIVSIFDKPHDIYVRDGINMICESEISFKDACLGTTVNIPNLSTDGEYKITIPPGTDAGKIFRLGGKGLPEFGTNFYGDLLIRIKVKIPKELNKDQLEFLEKYDKLFK